MWNGIIIPLDLIPSFIVACKEEIKKLHDEREDASHLVGKKLSLERPLLENYWEEKWPTN